MDETHKGGNRLPPNFVVYDHTHPSTLFSKEWIAYIESINTTFDDKSLKIIRSFERFTFNKNTGLVGNSGIPGLRNDQGKYHIYVKRFYEGSWKDFVAGFLREIPSSFMDRARCLNDLMRITVPNGDRFYPFTCLGDTTGWPAAIEQAAISSGTLLAGFDNGRFNVSDGQSYNFDQLTLDQIEPQKGIPANW